MPNYYSNILIYTRNAFQSLSILVLLLDVCTGDLCMNECANCGEKKPEYVIDDRTLCFDCYRAEKFYWAKET
jgi:hypothetical protein